MYNIVGPEGEDIAYANPSDGLDEPTFYPVDANARLIAAAPDLLASCRAALNDRQYKDWPGIADLLIAAVAKAEGR
jgi:predicted nucleic acid-binding protein